MLTSLALGERASPLFLDERFLRLAAFVGANLAQSGFSRFCPLESMLRRLGVKSGAAYA